MKFLTGSGVIGKVATKDEIWERFYTGWLVLLSCTQPEPVLQVKTVVTRPNWNLLAQISGSPVPSWAGSLHSAWKCFNSTPWRVPIVVHCSIMNQVSPFRIPVRCLKSCDWRSLTTRFRGQIMILPQYPAWILGSWVDVAYDLNIPDNAAACRGCHWMLLLALLKHRDRHLYSKFSVN